jgi:hypothetical protein
MVLAAAIFDAAAKRWIGTVTPPGNAMQRTAMLMYTSCGWFFADISR